MKDNTIDRRTFIKKIIKAGATISIVGGGYAFFHNRIISTVPNTALPKFSSYAIDQSILKNNFVILHRHDIEKMIAAGFIELGGIDKFIVNGDKVLIKPNVGFDRSFELASTTNPEVIKAIIKLCYKAGAKEVIVTDNPVNNPTNCFERTGIKNAVLQAGGRIIIPKTSDFVDTSINGVAIKDHWVTSIPLFAGVTKVIGVPIIKDHNLCYMSSAMKNWYGLFGGGRNRFHQDIHNVIADLAFMMKPTLIIGDATRILMRNGPTGGRLEDIKIANTLIFSPDQVAVDA